MLSCLTVNVKDCSEDCDRREGKRGKEVQSKITDHLSVDKLQPFFSLNCFKSSLPIKEC